MIRILGAEVERREEYVKHEEPDNCACYITLSYASTCCEVRESITVRIGDVV